MKLEFDGKALFLGDRSNKDNGNETPKSNGFKVNKDLLKAALESEFPTMHGSDKNQNMQIEKKENDFDDREVYYKKGEVVEINGPKRKSSFNDEIKLDDFQFIQLNEEKDFENVPHKISVEDDLHKNVLKCDSKHPETHIHYIGGLKNGLKDGHGRTITDEGNTLYEGSYRNNKKNGFGVLYGNNRRVNYVGKFLDDKYHGVGVKFDQENKTISIGRWNNNKPQGRYSEFDGAGKLVFTGEAESGKRNGKGMVINPGNSHVLLRTYKDNELLSKGVELDENSNLLYIGDFMEDIRSGFGIEYKQDGDVKYKGEFKDNLYHGTGVLYLDEKSVIKGQFNRGKVCGIAVKYDSLGNRLYQGEFKDNIYEGNGRCYMKDGSHYQGIFKSGNPVGFLQVIDKEGNLIYEGEINNGQYHGKGTFYLDNKKIYSGDFKDGLYNGRGRYYQDGKCVYHGEFENGKFNGAGANYEDGLPKYVGNFKNGTYDGVGIFFNEGEPSYAGEFKGGMLHGRVNHIIKGFVFEESIYHNNVLRYTRRYNKDDKNQISIAYEGYIKNNTLNGMGCVYNEYGEKLSEGFFEDGKLKKTMRVYPIELKELPKSDELNDTEYEYYRRGNHYVTDKKMGKYFYTGAIDRFGASGKGIKRYIDHIFKGNFINDKPYGQGTVYVYTGECIRGEFFTEENHETKKLVFNDIIYLFKQQTEEL